MTERELRSSDPGSALTALVEQVALHFLPQISSFKPFSKNCCIPTSLHKSISTVMVIISFIYSGFGR